MKEYSGSYEILPSIDPISFKNLESCKNKSFDNALSFYSGSPVHGLILDFAKHITLPYLYVDVKVHNLKDREIPCIPGWHLDRTGEHESEYVLMVAGNSLTEFNSGKYSVDLEKPMPKVNSDLIKNLSEKDVFSAKEWTPIYYNNLMPHRGSPAKYNGQRFLLRVCGSTNPSIKETKDFEPGIYARK
jgi:hypothetical protein